MSYFKIAVVCTLLMIGINGCGGDSDESMSDKTYVVILKSVPTGVCESQLYRETLKSYGFKGLLTEETTSDTSCQTYGKTNDGQFCAEAEYGSGDVNCVVGFDEYSGSYDDLSFRKRDNVDDLDIATNALINGLNSAGR